MSAKIDNAALEAEVKALRRHVEILTHLVQSHGLDVPDTPKRTKTKKPMTPKERQAFNEAKAARARQFRWEKKGLGAVRARKKKKR